MSYEIRNSLILLLTLIVINTGGYFLLNMKFDKNIPQLQQTMKKNQEKLQKLQTSLADLDYYEKQLEEIHKKLEYYPKIILPEQTIHQTYRYLEQVDRRGPFFNFRFSLIGVERAEDVITAGYSLAGEGNYAKIMGFINSMEYGDPLYKIQSLSIKQPTKKTPGQTMSDDLEVSIRFNGIFFSKEDKNLRLKSRFYNTIPDPKGKEYDPFKPLILDAVPPNVQNLPEIESARLIALTDKTAHIQDKNGKIIEMKKGHKVYLGQLSVIDFKKGQVTFQMNRGGIPDKVVLSLNTSGREKK